MTDLRHARDSATGWSDELRKRFDEQQLKPLLQVGERLATALRAADECIVRAQVALNGGVR